MIILAIRSGDYYMFDDLDDNDVTDLIPDSEMERKEKKHRREQERRGRRMTVSEVSKVERNDCIVKTFLFFSDMNLNDYTVKFFVKFH